MQIEDCRNEIDIIDTKIVHLLRRRAAISRRVGVIKAAAGLPVIDSGREDNVRKKAVRTGSGELSAESILRIYDEILAESQKIQFEVYAGAKEKEQVCK